MNSPKPIDPQWLSDTLTPYLRYAFSHALRSNARIKPYIQRAANACKNNLNTPGQDSDAQFEHVLQTVERRCRGLPVQTNVITDNLEALAQFLIGRAQVKGPYELPDLGTPGGGDRFGGPQQGFGVLIPREQPTAYNDIMSGRAAVNPVQSRHDQAQAGSLDTSKRPAHTNTSAPRQQEASTSTSGPSPHPPQTNESVSQQQNLSHAILSQPLQPQQVTAPTAPNPPHQSESTTIPDILLWSTSAELEAEMAAFRNLPRVEKMAKLTKILSSLQAKHAEKVLPLKSVSRERRTSVGRSRVTRYEMRKRQDAAMR
ncbi:hypothetical protein Ptr902_08611 [Pyrenophora tritici-repentis]|nr:hypothetical protein Ptr902_08611 [Pyrenophora tritici-repentis]